MRPAAVEFLVHMSLCAAVASVNSLSTDGLIDRASGGKGENIISGKVVPSSISKSDHLGHRPPGRSAPPIRHHRVDHTSITGARLDLQWRQLSNVEYLTDGGNSWIHTAVFNGKPVVVKTLKPECQDVAVAINEIEGELGKCLDIKLVLVFLALFFCFSHIDNFLLLFRPQHQQLFIQD